MHISLIFEGKTYNIEGKMWMGYKMFFVEFDKAIQISDFSMKSKGISYNPSNGKIYLYSNGLCENQALIRSDNCEVYFEIGKVFKKAKRK